MLRNDFMTVGFNQISKYDKFRRVFLFQGNVSKCKWVIEKMRIILSLISITCYCYHGNTQIGENYVKMFT